MLMTIKNKDLNSIYLRESPRTSSRSSRNTKESTTDVSARFVLQGGRVRVLLRPVPNASTNQVSCPPSFLSIGKQCEY